MTVCDWCGQIEMNGIGSICRECERDLEEQRLYEYDNEPGNYDLYDDEPEPTKGVSDE